MIAERFDLLKRSVTYSLLQISDNRDANEPVPILVQWLLWRDEGQHTHPRKTAAIVVLSFYLAGIPRCAYSPACVG